MLRKRWTPTKKEEITGDILKFREKRKWQIALRRYIQGEGKGSYYAPYFGLDVNSFRRWIEIQFDETLNWENFSSAWQFDQIVPAIYFDFEMESDLRLCWNFINIRVEKLPIKNTSQKIDVIAAKSYFEAIFSKTGNHISHEMVRKIQQIESSQIENSLHLEQFILANKAHIELISTFSAYEYMQLNTGQSTEHVLQERSFLKRHGE